MTDIFLHMEKLADIGFCYSRHFFWNLIFFFMSDCWSHYMIFSLKSFYWCLFLTLTMVLLITTTFMSNGNFSFLMQDGVFFFPFTRHKAWYKSYNYFFSRALKHDMNILHTNFKILIYPWINKVLKWNNHFRHQWIINSHNKKYFFFVPLYFEDN